MGNNRCNVKITLDLVFKILNAALENFLVAGSVEIFSHMSPRKFEKIQFFEVDSHLVFIDL